MDRNEQIMNLLADLKEVNEVVEKTQDTMDTLLRSIANDKIRCTVADFKECADLYNSTLEKAKERYSEMALILTVVAPESLGLLDKMLDSFVTMHAHTKEAIDYTIGYLSKLSD